MPLLRQLEFAFRTVAGIADPGRFGAPQDAGVTAPATATPNQISISKKRRASC